MRRIYLYDLGATQDLGQTVHRVAQLEQAYRAKGRSAGCDPLKFGHRLNVGPLARYCAEPPVLILEDQPVFAPMLPPTDRLDLKAAERMEGMCDPYFSEGRTCMPCSRRRLRRARSKARC